MWKWVSGGGRGGDGEEYEVTCRWCDEVLIDAGWRGISGCVRRVIDALKNFLWECGHIRCLFQTVPL